MVLRNWPPRGGMVLRNSAQDGGRLVKLTRSPATHRTIGGSGRLRQVDPIFTIKKADGQERGVAGGPRAAGGLPAVGALVPGPDGGTPGIRRAAAGHQGTASARLAWEWHPQLVAADAATGPHEAELEVPDMRRQAPPWIALHGLRHDRMGDAERHVQFSGVRGRPPSVRGCSPGGGAEVRPAGRRDRGSPRREG
jgi:hypothetical protein